MNVALVIFNRPVLTERILARIALARPERLFVIGDGPRPDRPEDVSLVKAVRKAMERVDWPCHVVTNFSDQNLGCGMRPFTGISWVFEQVDRCIILEDDCLPDPSFFPYCEELLERYRDEEKVVSITGDNFLKGGWRGPSSYTFSIYPFGWGWATWRRAWRNMDYTLRDWPALRETAWLETALQSPRAARYWSALFDTVAGGRRNDIWDYQWIYSCWRMGGMVAYPRVNLVENTGWGADSTHTREVNQVQCVKADRMQFPLRHPERLDINRSVDGVLFERVMCPKMPLWRRLLHRHTYGALIRRIPGVGRTWAKWRRRTAGL